MSLTPESVPDFDPGALLRWYLCRHCPAAITPDRFGQFRDREGFHACEKGTIVAGGVSLLHVPMPPGYRGGYVPAG